MDAKKRTGGRNLTFDLETSRDMGACRVRSSDEVGRRGDGGSGDQKTSIRRAVGFDNEGRARSDKAGSNVLNEEGEGRVLRPHNSEDEALAGGASSSVRGASTCSSRSWSKPSSLFRDGEGSSGGKGRVLRPHDSENKALVGGASSSVGGASMCSSRSWSKPGSLFRDGEGSSGGKRRESLSH